MKKLEAKTVWCRPNHRKQNKNYFIMYYSVTYDTIRLLSLDNTAKRSLDVVDFSHFTCYSLLMCL